LERSRKKLFVVVIVIFVVVVVVVVVFFVTKILVTSVTFALVFEAPAEILVLGAPFNARCG
jgi:predicted membrane metal-binding protein